MIILDTCAMVFDALSPHQLSNAAKKVINTAEKSKQLYCCDISLWEVAMLIHKKRLDPGYEIDAFLKDMLKARQIQVLPITVEIATLTATHAGWLHFDPADRIIASTAIYHKAKLVTCDSKLQNLEDVDVVW